MMMCAKVLFAVESRNKRLEMKGGKVLGVCWSDVYSECLRLDINYLCLAVSGLTGEITMWCMDLIYIYTHQTPASEAVEDTSVPLLLSVTLRPAHTDQASAQTRPHLSSPSVRGIEVKVLISTTAFYKEVKQTFWADWCRSYYQHQCGTSAVWWDVDWSAWLWQILNNPLSN